MPMISVSAEADENFSLSDSEEANKAKTLIAARMRRRKQKKKVVEHAKPSAISLLVDDGDESGFTDVETVEVEGSSVENSQSSSPAEDFTPIFDSVLQPQIVQIIDDHEGKTHVKTLVQGVVAVVDSDPSDDENGEGQERRLSLIEALTDIEDFDELSDDIDSRSDTSEMAHLIDQLELGGNVDTHNQEEEVTGRSGHGFQQRSSGSSMLLCPKSATGRKKTRKHRTKKKAASTPTGSTLLTVITPDEGPATDVESVSGLEEEYDDSAGGANQARALPSAPYTLLKVADTHDEGATDIEDFPFSDDEEVPAGACLAPGILVTGEASETESSYDTSGRSSRLGLTDIESVHGVLTDNEDTVPSHHLAMGGLGLPVNTDDPVTDVEDIDNVEVEDAPLVAPTIPRNGPALHVGQHQVVTIQEDENGRITSRKSAGTPGLLGFAEASQDGGLTDTEYIGTSADEDDTHSRGVTPEIEMFAGSTVRIKRHSFSNEADQPDTSDNETAPASHYSLMPPVQAVDALTDTEDMEMSDGETMTNQGQMDRRMISLTFFSYSLKFLGEMSSGWIFASDPSTRRSFICPIIQLVCCVQFSSTFSLVLILFYFTSRDGCLLCSRYPARTGGMLDRRSRSHRTTHGFRSVFVGSYSIQPITVNITDSFPYVLRD